MLKMNLPAFIILFFPTSAHADFSGQLVLLPEGCQHSYECTLGENFGFTDSKGIGWEADAGDITDGASIPKWAQFFAGEPFEEKYLPAAVLHDHYSKSVRPVRGWFQTQVMFHEALIDNGTSREKAAILFAGVLIGSGKWISAIDGKPCPTLPHTICINSEKSQTEYIIKQSPSFSSERYLRDFQTLTDTIVEKQLFDPLEITAEAQRQIPDDLFIRWTGGKIGTENF